MPVHRPPRPVAVMRRGAAAYPVGLSRNEWRTAHASNIRSTGLRTAAGPDSGRASIISCSDRGRHAQGAREHRAPLLLLLLLRTANYSARRGARQDRRAKQIDAQSIREI